ncbi:MAG: DUF4136 domain-containing protein [Bacteroidota bacterium]
MKNTKSLLLVAFVGLLLSGCATTAFVEKDDSVNFENYKTFTWLDPKDDSGSAPMNDLQLKNLRDAVSSELSKANWTEEKKNPDVILKHDILVEKAVKETNSPVYSQSFTRRYYNPYSGRFRYIYYPSQFMGYRNDDYVTREGTLTITMIDAKTDKVIWQGWTTEEVDNKNLTRKEIQTGVKNIFRKFEIAKN